MSKIRPECTTRFGVKAIPDDTALYMILQAVSRRRSLIRGKLDDDNGKHCALGCFWADSPTAALNTALVDEVAIYNDSIPKSVSGKERWKRVRTWLRWKIKVLEKKNS